MCVAAGAEPVEERDGPTCIRRPVDGAPGAVADPRAQQARDDQRDEQIDRDRTEPEPERTVRRVERDDDVEPADRREVVGDRGDDVHREEHHYEQRDVLVQRRGDEAREPRARPARDLGDAERNAQGQEHERDEARSPRVRNHSA